MTRVLVAEYICSTHRPGTDSSRVGSLWAEGWAMLSAVVEDFLQLPEVELRVPVAEGMATPWPDGVAVPVAAGREEREFRRLADLCELALVIAPEFDGILEERCRWAVQCGATLLGPSPDAVALCADKLALAEHWWANGVPTPATKLFDRWAFPPPVVVKPRDGAGSTDTYLLETQAALNDFEPFANAIVQPHVSGEPMSMATLIGHHESVPLVPCNQTIVNRGVQLHYEGGSTIAVEGVNEFVRRALRGIAGLAGFVGVDFIRTNDGFVAIEINPRLTTSYVALRRLCEQNLMDLLLDVFKGKPVREPTWRDSTIQFVADGNVRAV